MADRAREYVLLFKALADETRLKIVKLLVSGELCACELLTSFQITQPTLSYHMKILTDCGLVIGRRDGAWMRYRLDGQGLSLMQEFLQELLEKAVPSQVYPNDAQ